MEKGSSGEVEEGKNYAIGPDSIYHIGTSITYDKVNKFLWSLFVCWVDIRTWLW